MRTGIDRLAIHIALLPAVRARPEPAHARCGCVSRRRFDSARHCQQRSLGAGASARRDLRWQVDCFRRSKRACTSRDRKRSRMKSHLAWEFLNTAAPQLIEAGLGVILPTELTRTGQRRLRMRMRVGRSRSECESGSDVLTLNSMLTFRWQAELAGEVLDADELRELAKLQGAARTASRSLGCGRQPRNQRSDCDCSKSRAARSLRTKAWRPRSAQPSGRHKQRCRSKSRSKDRLPICSRGCAPRPTRREFTVPRHVRRDAASLSGARCRLARDDERSRVSARVSPMTWGSARPCR